MAYGHVKLNWTLAMWELPAFVRVAFVGLYRRGSLCSELWNISFGLWSGESGVAQMLKNFLLSCQKRIVTYWLSFYTVLKPFSAAHYVRKRHAVGTHCSGTKRYVEWVFTKISSYLRYEWCKCSSFYYFLRWIFIKHDHETFKCLPF